MRRPIQTRPQIAPTPNTARKSKRSTPALLMTRATSKTQMSDAMIWGFEISHLFLGDRTDGVVIEEVCLGDSPQRIELRSRAAAGDLLAGEVVAGSEVGS